MHPIVGQFRRLYVYLLAWIPMGVMLGYVLVRTGGLGTVEAVVLVPLLMIICAFLCLAAWFPCRATPVESSKLFRVLMTHGAAGALVSSVWVFVARLLFSAVAAISRWTDLDEIGARMTPLLFGVGMLLYMIAASLFYVILALQKSEEAKQSEIRANMLARDAELRALKAQINPHFLFNSLNSISALTTIDPQRAREMCIALAEFLRLTLGLSDRAMIPMQEEVALLNKFLSIEQIRFGKRLRVSQDVEADAMECMVLPLMLQPLMENAINHGIAMLPEGGEVRVSVRGRAGGEAVEMEIENDVDPDSPSQRRNGMGLKNVRERLSSHYGSDASMTVTREQTRFRVTLVIPAERISVQ